MGNSNKRRGDRAEREALTLLCQIAPDLLVPRPQRLLGAGRREDAGDLWVLPNVTVQVKHRADPAQAIRIAADAAAVQARRAGCHFALGLVPIPRARHSAVRWVACSATWPVLVNAAEFRSVTRALAHVRRDEASTGPRDQRVAVVDRGQTAALYVATLEAWLHAYRRANRAARPFMGPDRPG